MSTHQEETTEEINVVENQLVANAAMQLSNLRKEYQQSVHLQEASQLSPPPLQGQNFRIWPQQFHEQQQLQLFHQQQLYQQQQQRRQQQQQNLSLQGHESPESNSQEQSSYEEEAEDEFTQSLVSPVGSDIYDCQDQEGGSSLAGRIVDAMPDYPCLWNTHLRSYKDLNIKDQAWKELQTKLRAPGL